MEPPSLQAQEQWKRFNTFFDRQTIQQAPEDPRTHSLRLSEIVLTEATLVDNKYHKLLTQVSFRSSRIVILDTENRVSIFNKNIQGSFQPHSHATQLITSNAFGMAENSPSSIPPNTILVTCGEDSEGDMRTNYVKLWKLPVDYSIIEPKKTFLVGKLGEGDKSMSCVHLNSEATLLVIGNPLFRKVTLQLERQLFTQKGSSKGLIYVYESRYLLDQEVKMSVKIMDRRAIRIIQSVRNSQNMYDIYFSNDGALTMLENINEKKKISPNQVELINATNKGSVLVTFKNQPKTLYEFQSGKIHRSWPLEGEKRMVCEFKTQYVVAVLFEKRNERMENSQNKYHLHILDTLNRYIAHFETYPKLEAVVVGQQSIGVIAANARGERTVNWLIEKDNSFKIETFFKRSFYNEAWRFAKNQNCNQSLLAEISKLNGDHLYSKGDLSAAIKQYILTLGHVEPSYVIRKFLDVAQIDYLIEYLQKIHERKLAKKEHTALLLNCYVKKQKIQNLSQFLAESALDSDMFDIETAIKVCKDLKHTDEAMKLAEQKGKHQLFLRILIEDKKEYDRALKHIKENVDIEEKEKFLIEFGQELMKIKPRETVKLIKLLVKANSIGQLVKGRQRDAQLTPDDRSVLQELKFNPSELQALTVITFKKPDEYFRLFLINNKELESFLLFLVNDVPKLQNEQIVFHRLIEFYLETRKDTPARKAQCQESILKLIREQHTSRKADENHLLTLFKMYEFDEGIISICKKLDRRDDLLNFYIEKNRDEDILNLCREHKTDEINLWIQALKYFVKSDTKRYLPEILESLAELPNMSPLPILSILAKNSTIEYRYVKNFFLTKLQADRKLITTYRDKVKANMQEAEAVRAEFKKLKTTAKPFLSNTCVQCQSGLTAPAIHFMCGHSFHENCLSGSKQCNICSFEMSMIVNRKKDMGATDHSKFFKKLQDKRDEGFEVVSEFFGKGLFERVPSNP